MARLIVTHATDDGPNLAAALFFRPVWQRVDARAVRRIVCQPPTYWP
jgi:hypothetical protein